MMTASRHDGHWVRLLAASFEGYCDFHALSPAECEQLVHRLDAQLAERQLARVANHAARYGRLHPAQREGLDGKGGDA